MNSVKLNKNQVTPSKVVCVGRNYVEHIEELGNEVPSEMIVFMKPNSAISENLQSGNSEPIYYEGEICFLIKCNAIAAVGVGLDLTKRATQTRLKSKQLPWERSKSFDNSAVFGEFVSFDGEPSNLRLELFIDDVLTQHAKCSMMINSPKQIINELSSFVTLQNDDIVMTGTPKGVGEIRRGAVFVGRLFDKEALLVESKWVVG